AEAGSEHPLARPILETAQADGVGPRGIPGTVTPVPGKGIVSDIEGRRVLIGNPPLLAQFGIADDGSAARTAEALAADGKTPMIVAVDDRVIGVVAVADQIRPDAPEMVARLHQAGGKKVVMLTGDTRLVAEAVGVAMGAAGSAVAVETADIALMGDNLLRLPEAVGLAKRTASVMRQNIGIALVTVVVLLAGVFAGGVTMSIGTLVHEASVLVV